MILCTTDDLKDYITEICTKTNETALLRKDILSIPDEVRNRIRIVLTYGNYDDRLTANELKALPNLKWIQALSSGTEQLPLKYLTERKVLITTAQGIHSIPISEYVMGMILYFSKKIDEFNIRKKAKLWDTSIELSEVYGKTLGILGTGHIGKATASRAKAFGMQVVGVNRRGGNINNFDEVYTIDRIKEVIGKCDYICCVLPSNSSTKGLISRELINLMKDGVKFINVGRGDLIIEDVFLEALQNGKISCAALDVFQEEPLHKYHPFWDVDNLVITPHASAVTNMYMTRCLQIFYKNYDHFIHNDFKNMSNQLDVGLH